MIRSTRNIANILITINYHYNKIELTATRQIAKIQSTTINAWILSRKETMIILKR